MSGAFKTCQMTDGDALVDSAAPRRLHDHATTVLFRSSVVPPEFWPVQVPLQLDVRRAVLAGAGAVTYRRWHSPLGGLSSSGASNRPNGNPTRSPLIRSVLADPSAIVGSVCFTFSNA